MANPDASRAAQTALAAHARFAMRDVLVTIPRRFASMMPRLTPGARPKSSALTIRRFAGVGVSPDMPARFDRPDRFDIPSAYTNHHIVQVDRGADVAGQERDHITHLQRLV